jgi:hypothetical protein
VRNPHFHNNNHREESSESLSAQSEANRENLPQIIRRRHTRKEWIDKLVEHGLFCHYCKTELTAETLTKDHLTPTCRGGSSAIENMVPACLPCNQMKAWRTEDEFMSARAFLSTRRRGTSFNSCIPRPEPPKISYEERFNEPGLLKRLIGEREQVSWAWRNPA